MFPVAGPAAEALLSAPARDFFICQDKGEKYKHQLMQRNVRFERSIRVTSTKQNYQVPEIDALCGRH